MLTETEEKFFIDRFEKMSLARTGNDPKEEIIEPEIVDAVHIPSAISSEQKSDSLIFLSGRIAQRVRNTDPIPDPAFCRYRISKDACHVELQFLFFQMPGNRDRFELLLFSAIQREKIKCGLPNRQKMQNRSS